jgi:hypothetical protein
VIEIGFLATHWVPNGPGPQDCEDPPHGAGTQWVGPRERMGSHGVP